MSLGSISPAPSRNPIRRRSSRATPVLLTGWRVGEAQWGGYAGKARVKAAQLVQLPAGLSLKRAMAIGTAGFTAMLAVMALEEHGLAPGGGEVLVTGAAGGVGSVAVAVLAALGHVVTASTGRAAAHDYLRGLGAKALIDRAELAKGPARPLGQRALGRRDRRGRRRDARHHPHSAPLRRLGRRLRSRRRQRSAELGHSVPAARGKSFGHRFGDVSRSKGAAQPGTRLARDLPMAKLDAMTELVGLSALPELGRRILHGDIRGRIVVDLRAS